MILLIDNYDSFSYNLYQLIGGIEPNIYVARNDRITIAEIEALGVSHIILSPGPGRPEAAGICVDAVGSFAGKKPILGVCLGHQAICVAFGGVVGYAKSVMHGKTSDIALDNRACAVFRGLPPVIKGARYHSLAADPKTLPPELRATAFADGDIMGLEHKKYRVFGVQFHPESVLTPDGIEILRNFLSL
jgi:anthranilate synthase component 2